MVRKDVPVSIYQQRTAKETYKAGTTPSEIKIKKIKRVSKVGRRVDDNVDDKDKDMEDANLHYYDYYIYSKLLLQRD